VEPLEPEFPVLMPNGALCLLLCRCQYFIQLTNAVIFVLAVNEGSSAKDLAEMHRDIS
jgi:hypothetical protein